MRAIQVELVPENGANVSPQAERGIAESPLPRLIYRPGQSLAQAVYLSGLFQPPVLCSGVSVCGRCRMRILAPAPLPGPTPADLRRLSHTELSDGWRLACRHLPQAGMRVELPPEIRPFPAAYARRKSAVGRERGKGLERHMLAIDFGTTSLQWRQISVSGPAEREVEVVWQGGSVNPQMGAGSDVVARLALASRPSEKRQLREITLLGLGELTRHALELAQERGAREISALCLAGNPAMTYIALGLDVSGLAKAPYALSYPGGEWTRLSGLPPIWVPPLLSPFVGGDISAGYAALALRPGVAPPPYPFLLADLGTNGEFLLAVSPEEAWTASVALGPALEGTGLSQGSEARPGAVAGFSLSPKGLEARTLPWPETASQGMPPAGITGTGYIALLHTLLKSGALSREGRLCPENSGPMRRFFQMSADPANNEALLALPLGLALRASDVEELLKVKAAFSLGLQRLLARAGVATQDLAGVFVAGALGLHVNKQALEELGFFPPGMAGRIEAIGNSSLDGAALLLANEESRAALVAWAAGAKSVDLAADPLFMRHFADHMHFSWHGHAG